MRPSSRSKPVRGFKEILLIDGVKYFARRLLRDLVFQGWYGDRSLLPVFLGDVDPTQRLGSVLALFEPLMKLLDIPRGVLFIPLVRDAVHSSAGFLS